MATTTISLSNSQIEAMVSAYSSTLQAPVTSLQSQQTRLNARMSALTELKGKLQAFYSVCTGMTASGAVSSLADYSVLSSDGSVATATATSGDSLGAHSLFVTQLAKSDLLLSNRLTATGTTISTAEGAGVKTFHIASGSAGADVSVTLDGTETDQAALKKIATAITAAGIGVTASVVSDTPTTSRLVLTSAASGSANALTFSDVSGTLLADAGLTGSVSGSRTASTSTTAGYAYSDTAKLDAMFTFDNVDMVRSSNSISDVLAGVTISLNATQKSTDLPVSLIVGADQSTIQQTVQSFITAYNNAYNTVVSKTAVDPSKNVRQILAGDPTYLNLKINLRSISGSIGSTGTLKQLQDIGITLNEDGTLSLSDVSKLKNGIASGTSNIISLFAKHYLTFCRGGWHRNEVPDDAEGICLQRRDHRPGEYGCEITGEFHHRPDQGKTNGNCKTGESLQVGTGCLAEPACPGDATGSFYVNHTWLGTITKKESVGHVGTDGNAY
jgi:flagellar hook-associated protein 2